MLVIIIAICAVFLLVLQRNIYNKYWDKNLTANIRFDKEVVYEGDIVEIKEVITNEKWLPLPVLTVKFETAKYLKPLDSKNSNISDHYYRNDIFTMNSMRRVTRTIPVLCTHRGCFFVHDISLVSADLFLQNQQVSTRKNYARLYVYPKRIQDEWGQRLLTQLTGDVLSKRHRIEDPFEFRGIRDYTQTDEMRTINWKATAKTGALKVNTKNYTSLRAVRIFLNVEDTGILKHIDEMEYAISMTAALSASFLEAGMRVSLYTNGLDLITKKPVMVEENGGSVQLTYIRQSLARLDNNQTALDFYDSLQQFLMSEAENTYTMIITAECREEWINQILQLNQLKADYHILYVTNKNNRIQQTSRLEKHFTEVLLEEVKCHANR